MVRPKIVIKSYPKLSQLEAIMLAFSRMTPAERERWDEVMAYSEKFLAEIDKKKTKRAGSGDERKVA